MKCPYCNKEFLDKRAFPRSNPENRYYWGVIVSILSDELGYSTWEMHEILKAKFLRHIAFVKTKDGVEEVEISGSTAHLSTSEFEKYLENIRIWASSDLEISIPLPNEGETNVS